jgi:succinyl-diaminopimelate desuccinylase
MKAGLACQVAVARALAPVRERIRGRLILHFAVGEERAEPGTRSLLDAGFHGDLGIVLEPTGLDVAVAQRGAVYLRVELSGSGGHAGAADAADSPIDALADLLGALAAYSRELERTVHPLVGAASCRPTIARAGAARNMIPATLELVLDRRMIPGEDADEVAADVWRALSAALADRPGIALRLEREPRGFLPSETPAGSTFARCVERHAAAVRGPRDLTGTSFASDVSSLINDAGMDAVTFGPGSIGQAHAPDEYVELDQLTGAAEVLLAVAADVLAVGVARPR